MFKTGGCILALKTISESSRSLWPSLRAKAVDVLGLLFCLVYSLYFPPFLLSLATCFCLWETVFWRQSLKPFWSLEQRAIARTAALTFPHIPNAQGSFFYVVFFILPTGSSSLCPEFPSTLPTSEYLPQGAETVPILSTQIPWPGWRAAGCHGSHGSDAQPRRPIPTSVLSTYIPGVQTLPKYSFHALVVSLSFFASLAYCWALVFWLICARWDVRVPWSVLTFL